MKLNYQCPICGTPLGYEGLCWKCKSEQDRQSVMNWTAEQIKEKQELLISNIQRLANMEDPEFTIFWQLLSYQNAITPEIQSKALTAEIYYPCEIYYHAPENVRDGLIAALQKTDDSQEANNLMCCLAMQGDDKAMETLLELEKILVIGVQIYMLIRLSMLNVAAGLLTKKGIEYNSTLILVIQWSKEHLTKCPQSKLVGCGKILVLL